MRRRSVDYRKLDVPGRERFDGTGVCYAATAMELTSCRGNDVIVVGGENSASQGAIFLSQHSRRVWLLVRSNDLRQNMSSYLADRVEQTGNVEVRLQTEIRRIFGHERIEGIEIEDTSTGATRRIDVAGAFSFIGAVPRTNWLPPGIQTDGKGFVLTGRDASHQTMPHGHISRVCSRPAIGASSPPATYDMAP